MAALWLTGQSQAFNQTHPALDLVLPPGSCETLDGCLYPFEPFFIFKMGLLWSRE